MYVFIEQKPTYLKSVSYCKVSYCTVSEVLKYVSDTFFCTQDPLFLEKRCLAFQEPPVNQNLNLYFQHIFTRDGGAGSFAAFVDRAPEYDEPRYESLSSATHIIDLITVCLSRVNQFFLIAQRLEKTLKFAYQVHHKIFHSRQEILPSSNPRLKFSRGVSEVKTYPF